MGSPGRGTEKEIIKPVPAHYKIQKNRSPVVRWKPSGGRADRAPTLGGLGVSGRAFQRGVSHRLPVCHLLRVHSTVMLCTFNSWFKSSQFISSRLLAEPLCHALPYLIPRGSTLLFGCALRVSCILEVSQIKIGVSHPVLLTFSCRQWDNVNKWKDFKSAMVFFLPWVRCRQDTEDSGQEKQESRCHWNGHRSIRKCRNSLY